MLPELQTPRLRLRQFAANDIDAVTAMVADPEVMRFLGNGLAGDRYSAWQDMAAIVGHWHLRGFGIWAAEEKSSGAFVGRIGLQRPEGWPGVEAVWILARAHWGKGYAAEGGRAVIEHARRNLGFDRVISMIHPDNEGSIRVARKLGQTLERSLTIFGRNRLLFGVDLAGEQVDA